MMKQYFDDLVGGIEGALAADPENASPRKIYTLEVARIGQRLYGGEERVAWCGVTVPFDLLSAMGVTSCFVEFVGAMLASAGMVEAFLEEAEQVGVIAREGDRDARGIDEVDVDGLDAGPGAIDHAAVHDDGRGGSVEEEASEQGENADGFHGLLSGTRAGLFR